jgi:hypothetical protein
LNDISILMGSDATFRQEQRQLADCLVVGQLYLLGKEAARGLRLLPLVMMGRTPESIHNACYFYSRTESAGVRVLAYHLTEAADDVGEYAPMRAAIQLLTYGDNPIADLSMT